MPKPKKVTSVSAACRAAAILSQDVSLDIDTLDDAVRTCFEDLEQGSFSFDSFVSSLSNQTSIKSLAISVVFESILLTRRTVKHTLKTIEQKKDRIELQIKQGLASVGIYENRTKQASFERQLMKEYLDLVYDKEKPWRARYLGIKKLEPQALGEKTFYHVLPYWEINRRIVQPMVKSSALDVVRMEINQFLNGRAFQVLEKFEAAFHARTNLGDLSSSVVEGTEHLFEKWTSARFIILSLINLLWFYADLVDFEEGNMLEAKACEHLCDDARLFLNEILNSKKKPKLSATQSVFHASSLSPELQDVLVFTRSVEGLIKKLHAAYEGEALNAVDCSDLTDSSRRTLCALNQALFQLLYERDDPQDKSIKIPDDKAAAVIIADLGELKRLLKENPHILKSFEIYVQRCQDIPYLNVKIMTLVDVLIIYLHISSSERKALRETLQRNAVQSGEDTQEQFAQILERFDVHFVVPDEKHVEKHQKIGKYVIPFFTLLMAVSGIDEDMDTKATWISARNSQRHLKASSHDFQVQASLNFVGEQQSDTNSETSSYMQANLNSSIKMQRTGKQQIEAINNSANFNLGYFLWNTAFFGLSPEELAAQLNKLPKELYTLLKITQILDTIVQLFQHRDDFLEHRVFQQFLRRFFGKVREAYRGFEAKFNQTETMVIHNQAISRSIQSIFLPMKKQIEDNLEKSEAAVYQLERTLSDSHHTLHKPTLLSTNVHFIENQFALLFPDEKKPGLIALLPDEEGSLVLPQLMRGQSVETEFPSSPGKRCLEKENELATLALKVLIQHCYDNLSYLSRSGPWGHKGTLMRTLIKELELRDRLSDEELEFYLLSLVRVTFSYRETFFGQAKYTETRSGKALLSAIRKVLFNRYVHFGKLLFRDEACDVALLTDEQLLEKLLDVSKERQWGRVDHETSEDDLTFSSKFTVFS
jgi:hypothetical protein